MFYHVFSISLPFCVSDFSCVSSASQSSFSSARKSHLSPCLASHCSAFHYSSHSNTASSAHISHNMWHVHFCVHVDICMPLRMCGEQKNTLGATPCSLFVWGFAAAYARLASLWASRFSSLCLPCHHRSKRCRHMLSWPAVCGFLDLKLWPS